MTNLPVLKPQDITILNTASRSMIRSVLSSRKKGISIGNFLNKNNKYRYRTLNKLKDDTSSGGMNVNNNDLKKYIAVSTLLHCFDGWKYFSKALNCHLLGDSDLSKHLGYYAELRAVMSILAIEGIGVFNDIHFIVDNSGACKKLLKTYKTHDFVWLAFENWIRNFNTIEYFKYIIKPKGIAIDQCFQYCSIQSNYNVTLIWNDLLKDWGLDLKYFVHDRNIRNESSYRPNNILDKKTLSTLERIGFIYEFWKVFEPSSESRFHLFDMYIMAEFLRRIFKYSYNINENIVINNLAEFISHGNEKIKEDTVSFFQNIIRSKKECIINYAKEKSFSYKSSSQHLAILSRAAILLRLATGSLAELLNDTGIDSDILSFWLEKTGIEYGLWKVGQAPNDCADLWADVDIALSNVDLNSFPPELTLHDFWFQYPYECHTFSSCERIALWGMSL